MNFQSKLTLKLKKQNNIIPADSSKKCQNIDSSKSEDLSNNSVVSENDSFIEILHTVTSQKENISTSQSFFKMPPVDQDTHDIIIEKKQCPVCLQIVDDKNFITHVKSCGTSHNLPSELLIKAVDLQERQAAEREALGLPKIPKNKDLKKKKHNTNKQTKLKNGNDCNLDLAIAMSVSLQESKEAEILKESETLLEAGLENEAMEKRKTLESFGFISNQPLKSKPKNFNKTNAALFKQTKEGREKRITEKVAIILIDSDIDTSISETLVSQDSTSKLESKHLNKIRNLDNKLWRKSLLDVENINEFYVNNLSKFFKPCENNIFVESNTNNTELVDTSYEVMDNPNLVNAPILSKSIIEKNTMSEYSNKWKSMVDNQFMSDITIFVKDEREIPAHSIVLHVQCPGILDDIIKVEAYTDKSKKMLMWLEYSYEACLAFLELIYSGQESFIKTEYRDDYLNLATRYNVLIAITDDENHEWFSKNDEPSKRKSQELLDNSTNCKKYKASSPDMFMESDISGGYINTNFLGTTVVNDEKSSSILKTKQWLNDCNTNHQNHSSFTENLTIDIPSQTILPENSPSHSFHSASTVDILLKPVSSTEYQIASENNDAPINSPLSDVNNLSPKSSNGKLSENSVIILNESISVPKAKNSTFTNSYKEPELITLSSDSDTESLNMNLFNPKKRKGSMSSSELLNLPKRSSVVNPKLNDPILNSETSEFQKRCQIFALYIEKLLPKPLINRKGNYPKSTDPLFSNKNSVIKTVDDDSVFSASTRVLPNKMPGYCPHIIDLVEESADSSVSNVMNLNNSTSSKQEHFKTNEDDNLNSENSPNNRVLLESFQQDNMLSVFSNTTNYMSGNAVIQNENTKSKTFFDKNNGLNKPSLDSELLENTSKNKNLKLHPNNYILLMKTLTEVLAERKTNLTSSFSSSEFVNEHAPINSINIQDKLIQQSAFNIPCEETNSKEKDNSNVDQILDDPLMDCNDRQPINCSPQNVSPVLSNSILLNESEIQTQKNTNDQDINLDYLQTSISTNLYDSKSIYQKQNAVTPDKYGSRISTPKSFRRIRSESVIGSKEQITPLPDYSSMKTPDLRKEFDRYGLKDLGRRKGKLILRHIYDELHPLHNPEKSKHNSMDIENCSDSSDSSEHGISDYENGNYVELETLSQVNSSNKISVEMGFKQLLQGNEDVHQKILCYEPIWIEDLKEDLKEFNVNISMQKLMTFLDDKCITFRSKTSNDQRQKTLTKRNIKRKKLF